MLNIPDGVSETFSIASLNKISINMGVVNYFKWVDQIA